MKYIILYLVWQIKRLLLQFKLNSFSCSIFTVVDLHSKFEGYNKIGHGSVVLDSDIGLGSYMSWVRVQSARIGKYCSIGPGVRIGGLGRHPTDWISTSPSFYSNLNQNGLSFSSSTVYEELSNVLVGNDVWIGARAMVLDGVTIGNGAIIAAGSVVVKDVKPYEIVGGVPAKHIRYRCSSEVICRLESLNWWDWTYDELHENSQFFRMPIDIGVDNLERFKNGAFENSDSQSR